MSKARSLVLIFAVLLLVTVLPVNVRASLFVSISSPYQTAGQGSQVSYTVSFSGGLLGATYVFSAYGLPSGSYYFSPGSVSATSGSSTLIVSTGIGGAYCPSSYSFGVSVTNQGAPADSGSASGGLSVAYSGPPLAVSISTDKASYIEGDKIMLQLTVNRPAEGTMIVTPPSGSSSSFTFQTYTARTLTRTLTAAKPYGTYTVSVAADDYCNSRTTASATFSVGPNTYSVSIQLSGVPSQYSGTLLVDGKSQGTMQGSQATTLSFPIGSTHTLTVEPYVSGATGVRYFCAQNTLSVSSTGSYSFNYQTQYELTIQTSPAGIAQVGNGGWFNSGASADTGQAPQVVPGATGVQYVFSGWSVDGATQSGNQITIAMNGPHNATANYTTQYLLTINSPGEMGSPQGGGFYNAGSMAQFSVTSPEGYLIQQVFVQWQGDYTGTSSSGSITMNGPKTITAVWTTSYTNLYLAAGGLVVIIIIAIVLAMRRRGRKEGDKETNTNAKQEKESKPTGQ